MSGWRWLVSGCLGWAAVAGEPAMFRLPVPTRFIPEASAEGALSRQAEPGAATLVAHPEDAPGERWEFTDRVALQMDPSVPVATWMEGSGLRLDRTLRPGLYVLQASSAAEAWRTAALWSGRPEVQSVHPVAHPPWVSDDAYAPAPNDEFFRARFENLPGQWYLENRDPETGAELGVDINVRPAWAWTRGAGVTVGVADSGVQLDHPDLQECLSGQSHFNFDTRLPLGGPVLSGNLGAHGTSAAGIIGATSGNGLGTVGIAPEAKVASWVIWSPRGQTVTDEKLGDVFRHAADTVAVQNHSWGPRGTRQRGPSVLEDAGIEEAWTRGRGGLGTVMVRAAGNERQTITGAQAGDDGFANDPRSICVAGVRSDGRVAGFSEPGACVLVAAPSGDSDEGGLTTTDLTGSDGGNFVLFFPPFERLSDYRWGALGFQGTSAAAPVVSGVAALVLSVNPRLTARDVQQVLLWSSHHRDLADPSLHTNRAGLRVSHNLGFGIVDAGAAVRLAMSWSNRPPLVEEVVDADGPVGIPDAGLRVELETVEGEPAFPVLSGLPATYLHPEQATEWLPLADLGRALTDPVERLDGRGALIERGGIPLSDKLARAAAAGAAFAVVYNAPAEDIPAGSCPGGDQLCVFLGTDFASIPAIFLKRSAGLALKEAMAAHPSRRAQLHLEGAVKRFEVTRDLQCERVGVRLRTDFTGRGDLRITLRSPGGTVSVLQRYNEDIGPGPVDWTYWSTQHFYEPSAGTWELRVTDEAEGEGRGQVLGATLLLRGVPIADTDHDGLDDAWEMAALGTRAEGPADDSDRDGASHLRESLVGSDPRRADPEASPDVGFFNDRLVRVSWPGRPGEIDELRSGPAPGDWTAVTRVEGRFPVTSVVVPAPDARGGYFRVTPRE